MDLMGPITPAGMNGEKYILSMLDERSKIGIAKPLLRKSDTASTVISVLKHFERQSGNRIKRIRCDRGKEFLNEQLNTFLQSSGIQQETSAPYTPQQNGNAERYNRTIIEKVRAVMLDCGLDKLFWNHAVEFCSYVRNRLPCKPHDKTPFELLYKRKPDMPKLPRFGQRCFVLNNPSETVRKLDAKSKEGIFLGFQVGTKDAYKVYSDGKINISRNIVFCDDTNACLPDKEDSGIPSDFTWVQDSEITSENRTQGIEQNTDSAENSSKSQQQTENEVTHCDHDRSQDRRYPVRTRGPPQPFWLAHVAFEEPKSLHEAIASPQKDDWKMALDKEIRS